MIIGVPKEIKAEEYRVGMTPDGVGSLVREGHTVLVEDSAGAGSGFPDSEYERAGARVINRNALFDQAELIVKVKEPLPEEYGLLRTGQALFTYLHLAPNPDLTRVLLDRRVTGLAYETLEQEGKRPLLTPMSEIAGRMAPLMGAFYLQKWNGGSGILPTGTSGVKPAKALILGAGIVGSNAAMIAAGLGMETVVLKRESDRIRAAGECYPGTVSTRTLTQDSVAREVMDADIVVCAILVPGGRTPILIPRPMLRTMKKGSVIVDVSVDQGGCAETSRPTTHRDPVYEVDGILHYCVANMPGAYPRTSTLALTSATLPWVVFIAQHGIERSIRESPDVRSSLNTHQGAITNNALRDALRGGLHIV